MKLGKSIAAAVLVAGVACATSTACSSSSNDSADSGGKLNVVATINAWGSIASQLGGDKIHETSIITNPDTDPHDYEPTPADGRAVAKAQVVIANGIGYDSWAQKLLAANPASGRTELNVGNTLGIPDDGNPHQWYSPDSVLKTVNNITDSYKKADPADAAYFDTQRDNFVGTALAKYNALIADIKAKFSQTPVGASESIFAPLAQALGLDLVTPPTFLKAISEGTDPSPADKSTIDQQIADRKIKVYVYNSQNSTPDVQAQVDAAKAHNIPVATVTETLAPEGATFQDWQSNQLQSLENALSTASGQR
ncbi:metal ABC transporter solute-binding protein, Zn/Mn family [Jongsikchunia kroppenstedtii]|uniref:metal ABC transporter solute-binding protein, Zn/Mn family n=1 Tax=Jongsikchunia kroppenstedtii TaxID=1121721 RepID=UPI0003610C98|nr:zinc ABC transporter substrate-binding protein [Jongsikchunia kroppenstedtii]